MTEMDNIRPGAEVSTAAQWKQSGEAPVPLVVPSGNTCLARAPGMRHFVRAGMVPNSLLPIVMRAIKSGTSPDVSSIEKDGGKVNDMIQMMDNVICAIVVMPRVVPLPPEEDLSSDKYDPGFERDEDLLYVDDVDPEDKAFIFQWACGGTSDLEQFRGGAGQPMGSAPGGKNVQRAAKRSGGAKKAAPKKSGQSRKR